MTDPLVTPPGRRLLPGIFALAALIAAGLGVPPLLQGACPSCTGLLSLVLPWTGFLFYGALAVVARRSPESALVCNALSLAVFVHACLVTEMVLLNRLCPGCLTVAGLAFLAAGLYVSKTPPARVALASALLLGAAAGFLYPADRVEDTLTRRFWPAHILTQAPAFVDRAELGSCTHPGAVRLFAYEDERTCQSCSGLEKRLFGSLRKDFPTDVCIHDHIIKKPAHAQTLPVIVLLSRKNRLLVVEGLPDYKELSDLLRTLIAEGGEAPRARAN
jgi:hypothetical protein